MLTIPNESLDLWLAELKPYQRETIEVFLASGDPESAAKLWLTSTGSNQISAFGGIGKIDPTPFWDKFKAECDRFICDESAYSEDKKSLIGQVPISKQMLISVMSSALGVYMGSAATLLAPAVTIILFTVGKLGLNAYCTK